MRGREGGREGWRGGGKGGEKKTSVTFKNQPKQFSFRDTKKGEVRTA